MAAVPTKQRLQRHFSYSDRIRYYWPDPRASAAVGELFGRLPDEIPETLISQYLGRLYSDVVSKRVAPKAARTLPCCDRRGIGALFQPPRQADEQSTAVSDERLRPEDTNIQPEKVMASVSVANARKSYGHFEVLHGVDIDIQDGEFVILVGPSGCGKSTLLRMIAGLEEISAGRISIGSKVVNNVAPKERDIAMVFQSYALYPHLTVEANMGFSLKLAKAPKEQTRQRVREAAEILGLEHLLDRYPKNLSGGQRQRVAMGRAIVRNPQVFLFDEPLSNLDAKLRVQMRSEIKQLHQRLKTTTIYVTHDQIEAMTMADRIVVMRDGFVEQIGSPLDLYDRPANLFVAGFIGSPAMNLIRGQDQHFRAAGVDRGRRR